MFVYKFHQVDLVHSAGVHYLLHHSIILPDERRVEHRGAEEARQTLISLELAERAHLDEVRLGLPLSALDCIAHSP